MVWVAFSKHTHRTVFLWRERRWGSVSKFTNWIFFPALRTRKVPIRKTWYQQDGATAHCTKHALKLLSNKFGDRIFSGRTDRIWPPRSLDLNPCDYYLWGRVKEMLYSTTLTNLEELRAKILEMLRGLSHDELAAAINELPSRLQLLRTARGKHFEWHNIKLTYFFLKFSISY